MRVAESLSRGTWIITHPHTGAVGPSVYGIGMSLLLLPAVVTARLLTVDPWDQGRLLASLTNPLLVALLATLLFKAATWLRLSPARALFLSLLCTFATPFCVYTQYQMSEPAAAVAILAAAMLAWRESPRRLLLAGALAGFSVLVKPAMAVTVVPLAAAVTWPRRREGWRGPLTRAAWFTSGGLPMLAVFLGYDHLRFSAIVVSGHPGVETLGFREPLAKGVIGLLTSVQAGIALYAPIVLIGIAGLGLLAWRAPRLGITWLAIFVACFVLHAKWNGWAGGHWGPRLVLPVFPFAILGLAPLLAEGRTGPALVTTLGGVSVVPNIIGMLHDPRLTFSTLWGTGRTDMLFHQWELLSPADLQLPAMRPTSGTFWPTLTPFGTCLLLMAALSLLLFTHLVEVGRTRRTAAILAAFVVAFVAIREHSIPYRVLGRSLRRTAVERIVEPRSIRISHDGQTFTDQPSLILSMRSVMELELALAPGTHQLQLDVEREQGREFGYELSFAAEAVAVGVSRDRRTTLTSPAIKVHHGGRFAVVLRTWPSPRKHVVVLRCHVIRLLKPASR